MGTMAYIFWWGQNDIHVTVLACTTWLCMVCINEVFVSGLVNSNIKNFKLHTGLATLTILKHTHTHILLVIKIVATITYQHRQFENRFILFILFMAYLDITKY